MTLINTPLHYNALFTPPPHYLNPPLPSHISPQQNSIEGFSDRRVQFAFFFSLGGGQSGGWVGRGRYGFLESKTHTKWWGEEAGVCGTHSLFVYKSSAVCVDVVRALWTHTHTHTNQVIWLLASLSRHHIEAQRECVTDPHSEREAWQDGLPEYSLWILRPAWILNQHSASSSHTNTHKHTSSSSLSSLIIFDWISLLPFYRFISFNRCFSHRSCGEGL